MTTIQELKPNEITAEEKRRWRELITALKTACRYYHKAEQGRSPGTAKTCICGKGNGSSQACAALAMLKQMLRHSTPQEGCNAEFFRFVRHSL